MFINVSRIKFVNSNSWLCNDDLDSAFDERDEIYEDLDESFFDTNHDISLFLQLLLARMLILMVSNRCFLHNNFHRVIDEEMIISVTDARCWRQWKSTMKCDGCTRACRISATKA